jgi:hypothetical protein
MILLKNATVLPLFLNTRPFYWFAENQELKPSFKKHARSAFFGIHLKTATTLPLFSEFILI